MAGGDGDGRSRVFVDSFIDSPPPPRPNNGHQSRNYSASMTRSTQPNFGSFRIPSVILGTTDRRILSSTVDSFLSKREDLTLVTTCFFRDVLLADFPPETFIQESSLSQSVLQVLKDSWEDSMVNYAAFQTLMKLSDCLRVNIGFLNSTEFYLSVPVEEPLPLTSRSLDIDYRSYSPPPASLAASTEYFLENFFQLMSTLSSSLTYNANNMYIWVLLENYSSLLHQYLSLLSKEYPKATRLRFEEILLDVSQYYLRNLDSVHPAHVACVMASLLSNFGEQELTLASMDIRRAIWAIASNSKLSSSYSWLQDHFVQVALPFEPDLKKASDSVGENDRSSDMFRAALWWKIDVLNDQRSLSAQNRGSGDTNQLGSIPDCLSLIQNSASHQDVFQAIDHLWGNLLLLNFSRKILPASSSVEILLVPPACQWREAFYRFLSVEPTSSQDEYLLVRVLDILSYVVRTFSNSEEIREWIIPLVAEKDGALQRLMRRECTESISSAISTHLSCLSYSAFEFCSALLQEGSSSDQLGEFFNVCAEVLKLSYDTGFPSCVILYTVLKPFSSLISLQIVQEKLKETPQVTLSLLEVVANGLQVLNEQLSPNSYRNHGAVKYGVTILSHLSHALVRGSILQRGWIGHLALFLPSLLSTENAFIKSSVLQMCVNITSTEYGAHALITQLESPSLLWRFALTQLTVAGEPSASIVKQKAAAVLLNLTTFWEQMQEALQKQLEVPRVEILQDLLNHLVCWDSKISDSALSFRLATGNKDDVEGSGDHRQTGPIEFITPNVLTKCANIIVRLMRITTGVDDLQNSWLLREISVKLMRILGSFDAEKVEGMEDEDWILETLISLTNAVQALLTLLQVDKKLALIIIADRQNLSKVILYLSISVERGESGRLTEVRSALWKHVFVLLTNLIADSGQNFEDLDRLIWSHRDTIFIRLSEWLNIKQSIGYRKLSTELASTLFRVTYCRQTEAKSHSLCQVWKEPDQTYGSAICSKLLDCLGQTVNVDERSSFLSCLNHLILLSQTAKLYALQHLIVKKLVRRLRQVGANAADLQFVTKRDPKTEEEIKWILTVLMTLFYDNTEAKKEAMNAHFADAVHTLFGFIKSKTDLTLLHTTIDCLINFTAEFPEGAHSLTLTTGLPGVDSRKIATPLSQYVEILKIFESELNSLERNQKANLRTAELLFSLVQNTVFSIECRNILIKCKVLSFLSKFHPTEIRKWSVKHPQMKVMYLKWLVELTVYPDAQLHLSKIPDSIRILLTLSDNEALPSRLYALQVLRNLCFHSGNRAYFLHESGFFPSLVKRLNDSDNLEELECTGVALWAITANSEKGKVCAKRAGCLAALRDSIRRLRITESSEKSALPNLISLFEKVSTVLGSNNSSGDETS